jgi:hypothetical protein
MTQEDYRHPIAPPPELVRQWMERTEYDEHTWFYESYIAEQAAQWGADQELEACLRLVEIDAGEDAYDFARYIRAARRPEPKQPSLKEQALLAIDTAVADDRLSADVANVVRRALEQLDD